MELGGARCGDKGSRGEISYGAFHRCRNLSDRQRKMEDSKRQRDRESKKAKDESVVIVDTDESDDVVLANGTGKGKRKSCVRSCGSKSVGSPKILR